MTGETQPIRPKLKVIHLSATRKSASDVPTDSTFKIWRELSKNTASYLVLSRSKNLTFSSARLSRTGRWRGLPSFKTSEFEFFITQFLWLIQIVRQRPHVIVVQCPMSGGLVAGLAQYLIDTKIFVELHGNHFFSSENLRGRLVKCVTRFVLKRATRIRALSSSMARKIEVEYPSANSASIVVIPPRVDRRLFSNEKFDYSTGPVINLVMVGAVNENKGQLRLLNSLQGSGVSYRVHLVGNGPDLPIIKSTALQYKNSQIVFHGAMTHGDLGALLPQMDVLVLNSKTEAVPRVLLEALTVGLPIIASDCGFCGELLEYGKYGSIFEVGDDTRLLALLGQLADGDDLFKNKAVLGQVYARDRFDSDEIFKLYREEISKAAES